MALAMGTPMPNRFPSAAALAVAASLLVCSNATAQQTDQITINLPTTLSLKKHKSYFRITHRFSRDLRRGSVGQLAEDFFSLDNGAIIGLEYRFGITGNLQAGIHRSIFGKTINLFSRWDALAQSGQRPFGFSVTGSIEGQDNLRTDPQPAISATLSHVHGRLGVYATPSFVHDAHTPTLRLLHEGHDHGGGDADPDVVDGGDKNDTAFVGLGMRLRVLDTVSVVGEASPRLYGYRPERAAWNVGVEKLTRGHVLQLNFGNSWATTPGMLARGGSEHDVYMGFNVSRKW